MQELFHLPLAGTDVDITHVLDQGPSDTGPMGAQYNQQYSQTLQYRSTYDYEPAPRAGPMGGREVRRGTSAAGRMQSATLPAPAQTAAMPAATPASAATAAPKQSIGMLAEAPAGPYVEDGEVTASPRVHKHRHSKNGTEHRSSRPTDALMIEGTEGGVTPQYTHGQPVQPSAVQSVQTGVGTEGGGEAAPAVYVPGPLEAAGGRWGIRGSSRKW